MRNLNQEVEVFDHLIKEAKVELIQVIEVVKQEEHN